MPDFGSPISGWDTPPPARSSLCGCCLAPTHSREGAALPGRASWKQGYRPAAAWFSGPCPSPPCLPHSLAQRAQLQPAVPVRRRSRCEGWRRLQREGIRALWLPAWGLPWQGRGFQPTDLDLPPWWQPRMECLALGLLLAQPSRSCPGWLESEQMLLRSRSHFKYI